MISHRNTNNVDFEMSGNTNELGHIIKHNTEGSPTRSQINFGFGLRKYKSSTNFQSPQPWKFPGIKGAKEAIANDTVGFVSPMKASQTERRSGSTKKFSKNLYSDKFPQRNANAIRHMFGQTSHVGSIKWEAGLRWNSDKNNYKG